MGSLSSLLHFSFLALLRVESKRLCAIRDEQSAHLEDVNIQVDCQVSLHKEIIQTVVRNP